ncbi:hypothetical protein OAF41_00165 [bacterium]|nr:hypothetical protein [bacterium]
MSTFDLERELEPQVIAGDTRAVIDRVAEELQKLQDSPFHRVIDLDFSNSPEDLGKVFADFIRTESKNFPVEAVYTETNGFAFNTDAWFFDLFAYKNYQGHDDYGWLAEWDSGDSPTITLTGMEGLQEIYASWDGDSDEAAEELCSLMVVAKFQDLVRRTLPFIDGLACPILATSHDYDFIAELRR